VRLRLVRDGQGHRLLVEDDGKGFDVEATTRGPGYGLTSMRERALALPGTFDIRSVPEQGTTVGVTWE
jgi:signal transduction histidine kinase